MRVAPFVVSGYNQHNTPMGTNLHLAPDTHALFFGPLECARHTFADLVDDPHGSLLVISDVQTSLGVTEDLVREAVKEICIQQPQTRAFIFCTACQTVFTGIDMDGLCSELHRETGLCFGHLEANRMSSENIPGKARKSVPGGDRYHSRLATFRMLEQGDLRDMGRKSGVLVLTEDKLDANCDFLELAHLDGIDWVRGVGDIETFDDFLECSHARLVIATSMPWRETGNFFEEKLNIPFLYLPTSYSLEEIDNYYKLLYKTLEECVPEIDDGQRAVLTDQQQKRRSAAMDAIDVLLNTHTARNLEIDMRLIARPFSLVEALLSYGFKLRSFEPSPMRIQHKEEDDAPAFERLARRFPAIGRRYAARPMSKDRRGGTSTKHGRTPGRYIEFKRAGKAQRVPEETAWWGYSSIVKLADEIVRGQEKLNSNAEPRFHSAKGKTGKWDL